MGASEQLTRSVTVPRPIGVVFDFLGDLAASPHWDTHTVRCRRLDDGPLGVGSRYDHVRTWGGHEVGLDVEVIAYDPPNLVRWQGGNRFATGTETIRFEAVEDGTRITHGVEVTLLGPARVGRGMLSVVMRRIADDGEGPLRAALLELPTHRDGTGEPDGR